MRYRTQTSPVRENTPLRVVFQLSSQSWKGGKTRSWSTLEIEINRPEYNSDKTILIRNIWR